MIFAFFAVIGMYSRISSYSYRFTVFNNVWLYYANVGINEQIKENHTFTLVNATPCVKSQMQCLILRLGYEIYSKFKMTFLHNQTKK